MTKDELSGLAFHMKQSEGKVFLVGDLRGVRKTEALVRIAKDERGVYINTTEYLAKAGVSSIGYNRWSTIGHNLRGISKKLFVDEGCIDRLINHKIINSASNKAAEVLEYMRMSEKVLLNTKDIKAVNFLHEKLNEELRNECSFVGRMKNDHEDRVKRQIDLLKELGNTFTFLA